MTVAEILQWLDDNPDEYVMRLDRDWNGCCPCFWLTTADGVKIHGHCWRICSSCSRCGLHITPFNRELADRLKARLDSMQWYGEWDVIRGGTAT